MEGECLERTGDSILYWISWVRRAAKTEEEAAAGQNRQPGEQSNLRAGTVAWGKRAQALND